MTLPARPTAVHPAPLNFRRSHAPQPQSDILALYRDYHDITPPTPGVDETPYIRFAIEQLTRDEEVSGRGRQGSDSSLDYPIEPIIPDEGLGYYSSPARDKRVSKRPRRSRALPEEAETPGKEYESSAAIYRLTKYSC
jgi:hypothetical protein